MKLLLGDCLERMKEMPDNSVDAIVTDPPYGLAFMGKKWDYDVPSTAIWKEVFRVLKPGGHLLSFGGTRTYHRMVVNIEDAGFEIRDQIQWLYGSGFPKLHDVSKGIDKAAGAERAESIWIDAYHDGGSRKDSAAKGYSPATENSTLGNGNTRTLPSTDSAKQWQGWGTALKPANEPICFARKPLSEKTLVLNVQRWGTGAINIDGCRVEAQEKDDYGRSAANSKGTVNAHEGFEGKSFKIGERSAEYASPRGRWPANLILDEEAAALLDFSMLKQPECGLEKIEGEDTFVGKKTESKSVGLNIDGFGNSIMTQFQMAIISTTKTETHSIMSFQILNASKLKSIGTCTIEFERIIKSCEVKNIGNVSVVENGNCLMTLKDAPLAPIKGIAKIVIENTSENGAIKTKAIGTSITENIELGPSRFFYCAKASKAERNAGLEGMPEKAQGAYGEFAGDGRGRQIEHQPTGNHHPTVKPLKLIAYLCRLITPPNGIVLDPFMGSGSTGVAAKQEGFDFIGIEMNEEYFEIAKRRIG